MRLLPDIVIAASVLVVTITPASAQSDIRGNEWMRGTTLSGSAGIALDSSHSGPALAGAIGWELTPRLAIEGAGSWLDLGDGRRGFGASVKTRAHLTGRHTLNPFVEGGFGLYRATFRHADAPMPHFYRRRMPMVVRVNLDNVTFTDPAFFAGGGLELRVSRRFALRPDVETMFVFRDGRQHLVTTIAVRAAFQIEHRPITR
jgi:hypothetical protein